MTWVVRVIYLLNIIFVILMVFIERRKPERISAWILLMAVAPVVGFVIYVLVGGGLSWNTKRMIKRKAIVSKKYDEYLLQQVSQIGSDELDFLSDTAKKYKDLIMFNANNSNSIYTGQNSVEYFSDGNIALLKMKEDMMNAKKSINLQAYIFANDFIGKQIIAILEQKALQGVDVKLMYDSVGSLYTGKKIFRNLKKFGGKVAEFFPPLFHIKLFNLKANYRNHRKILVIDDEVAYTGGLNFRKDHYGYKKRLSPWVDAHIRVEGACALCLEGLFLSDFAYAYRKNIDSQNYLQKIDVKNINFAKDDIGMQIVQSGPNKTSKDIKEMFIKMINSAKKSISIQTPYFILGDSIKENLKIALFSGVQVNIMLPKKPDKHLVYMASLSFAREMQEFGANIYLFDGFMHAKTMSIDDKILTIGSCNFDIRSFELNFEANAIIYDEESTKQYVKIFNTQIENCQKLDKEYFKKSSFFKKMLISVCRIFSPLL